MSMICCCAHCPRRSSCFICFVVNFAETVTDVQKITVRESWVAYQDKIKHKTNKNTRSTLEKNTNNNTATYPLYHSLCSCRCSVARRECLLHGVRPVLLENSSAVDSCRGTTRTADHLPIERMKRRMSSMQKQDLEFDIYS